MSSNGVANPPAHAGRIYTKLSPKNIGPRVDQSGKLRARMKADDSASVNMSDRKLGGGR